MRPPSMMVEFIPGVCRQAGDVRAFIAGHPNAQLYHSAAWLGLLLDEVGDRLVNVVARDRTGAVAGWMPLFIKDGPIGSIANSCPYNGSHGGVLARDADAFDRTLAAAVDFLRSENVLSVNVIHPLKDTFAGRYAAAPVMATVPRAAQIKALKGLEDEAALLASVGGLVRSNLKRKCWKNGITVARDETPETIEWLLHHHEMQMRDRGVQPKSRRFFDSLIGNIHATDVEGRIYVGRRGNTRLAAVFLCVWRDWAEYLTPVFDMEYRNLQPLTAVIFGAMRDCAHDGCRVWNFGGSGKALDNVKLFKESWGGETVDYVYHVIDTSGGARVRNHAAAHGNGGYGGYFLYPF